MPDINNKIPSKLTNDSEQRGNITVPYTKNHLLSPLYSKLNSSTKTNVSPTQQ